MPGAAQRPAPGSPLREKHILHIALVEPGVPPKAHMGAQPGNGIQPGPVLLVQKDSGGTGQSPPARYTASTAPGDRPSAVEATYSLPPLHRASSPLVPKSHSRAVSGLWHIPLARTAQVMSAPTKAFMQGGRYALAPKALCPCRTGSLPERALH